VTDLLVAPGQPDTLYATGSSDWGPPILRSIDGGAHWTGIQAPGLTASGAVKATAIAAIPGALDRLYLGVAGYHVNYILSTDNGGVLPRPRCWDIAPLARPACAEPQYITEYSTPTFLGISGWQEQHTAYALWSTRDATVLITRSVDGQPWEDRCSDLPYRDRPGILPLATAAVVDPQDRDRLDVAFDACPQSGFGSLPKACSDAGVFQSRNGGQTWEGLGQLHVHVNALTLAPDRHVLYAGTNRGVYAIQTEATPVGREPLSVNAGGSVPSGSISAIGGLVLAGVLIAALSSVALLRRLFDAHGRQRDLQQRRT